MHYDPMLAKVSTHAETRGAAIDRKRDALRRYPVLGVTTNGAYLDEILAHAAFVSGDTHTHFLEEHFADWRPDGEIPTVAFAAATVAEAAGNGASRTAAAGPGADAHPSPWDRLGHFRLNGLE
jgi:acetyl/propionyl-CoA carboxylase alpha subunit